MTSRRTLFVVGILLAILILALHETEAKGSRSSRRSSRQSTSRSRKTQRTPASSKPKPKTFHSSVTHSQIRQTKKSPFNRRFIVAAAAGIVVYSLVVGPRPPVYSGRYRPYYETTNIVIPKHRALQIKQESYHVLTNDGSRNCSDGNLTKYDARNIVNVTTKVSYEKVNHVVATIPPYESTDTKQTNLTVSAEAINNYVAMIEIRIAFNQSILTLNATSNTTANTTIDLTNCTIMVYKSKAYVVDYVESFAFRNEASFVLFLFALFVSIMMN